MFLNLLQIFPESQFRSMRPVVFLVVYALPYSHQPNQDFLLKVSSSKEGLGKGLCETT
jgi:hypothetical protein